MDAFEGTADNSPARTGELTVSIDRNPDAPSQARGQVAGLVADASIREDLLLAVSELVTNGVLYGGGEQIELVARVVPGEVLFVQVSHDRRNGPNDPPGLAGGHGLVIVDALSDAWGIEASPQRVTTWFVMRPPPWH